MSQQQQPTTTGHVDQQWWMKDGSRQMVFLFITFFSILIILFILGTTMTATTHTVHNKWTGEQVDNITQQTPPTSYNDSLVVLATPCYHIWPPNSHYDSLVGILFPTTPSANTYNHQCVMVTHWWVFLLGRERQGLTLGFCGFWWLCQGFLNNRPNFISNVILYIEKM